MPMAAQQTIHPSGLSEAVAKARLLEDGPNELPRHSQRTAFRIILDVIREPMLALLIGGGVVYLALGDAKEAIILLVFACLSVLITVVQEARTERVLDALRDLTSPRALVIRDGERKRIAGRDVVRGDLIILAEGALGTATEMKAIKNYAGHRLSPWLGHLMVSRSETARPCSRPAR